MIHNKVYVCIFCNYFCVYLQTVADCVNFYYLTKKRENYKQLLRKQNMKRKRNMPKAQVNYT